MSIHNLYFERGKGHKWRYVSSSFSKTFYDIAIVLCACLLSLNIIVSLEKLFGLREAQICREDKFAEHEYDVEFISASVQKK